jgi:hypothetical protein
LFPIWNPVQFFLILDIVDSNTGIQVLSNIGEFLEIDCRLRGVAHIGHCFAIGFKTEKPAKGTTRDQRRIDVAVEACPGGFSPICYELFQNRRSVRQVSISEPFERDHRPNEAELSYRWKGRALFSVFYFLISPL